MPSSFGIEYAESHGVDKRVEDDNVGEGIPVVTGENVADGVDGKSVLPISKLKSGIPRASLTAPSRLLRSASLMCAKGSLSNRGRGWAAVKGRAILCPTDDPKVVRELSAKVMLAKGLSKAVEGGRREALEKV